MRLGYRAVIIEGKSSHPEKRYQLKITKEGASLSECPDLKGLRTYACAAKLVAQFSKRAAFMICGPVGEALMTAASVAMTDEDNRYPTRHAGGSAPSWGRKG
jgi:aldehyde:ferredoxin oxidoreductase